MGDNTAQQAVFHWLVIGNLGTDAWEPLLSSDSDIELTSMEIERGLRREAGRASIQLAVLLKQHADHAVIMQVLLDPLMLQRTLSSTELVMYKSKGYQLTQTQSRRLSGWLQNHSGKLHC